MSLRDSATTPLRPYLCELQISYDITVRPNARERWRIRQPIHTQTQAERSRIPAGK